MSELYLRQPGITCIACGPFNKHCKKIRKFTETGTLKHIYKNKLGKACSAHDAAYSDIKDLAKRTISDKVLKGRT